MLQIPLFFRPCMRVSMSTAAVWPLPVCPLALGPNQRYTQTSMFRFWSIFDLAYILGHVDRSHAPTHLGKWNQKLIWPVSSVELRRRSLSPRQSRDHPSYCPSSSSATLSYDPPASLLPRPVCTNHDPNNGRNQKEEGSEKRGWMLSPYC